MGSSLTIWERLLTLPQILGETPVLAIAMTILAFFAANRLYIAIGRPVWLPPVMPAAAILAGMIALLGLDVDSYLEGAGWLMLLLGPATVALGVPLYQNIHHIRAMLWPIIFTLPIAALLAVVYTLAIAWALGASPTVMASLAPKSVTAPIALGIGASIGSSVPLLMAALLITGVFTTLFVEVATRLLKITDERIIGFALGLNGHAVGTVRAFEISTTAGAFSSLGMSLTGLFTALFLPIMFRL
jgi:putative effector of murein hydrolase